MFRNYCSIRKKMTMVLFLLAMLMMVGTRPALGANRIQQAKQNVQTGGKLKTTSKGVRYKKADKTYLKNTWASINGKIYYFKKDGYAATGWFTYKKLKYHAGSDGVVEYDKQIQDQGNYYYLKENGRLLTDGWKKIGSDSYYFDENGIRESLPLSKVKYVFVGDSRTHGMQLTVSCKNTGFVCKDSTGYSYLVGQAQNKLQGYLKKSGLIVIFNFGVNDLGNVDYYIAYYKKLIAAYPKDKFYFMAVNPINYSSKIVSNAKIKAFNKKIKKAFPTRYIKTYTYLKKNGFETSDGLHYTAATYQKIYNYTMKYAK